MWISALRTALIGGEEQASDLATCWGRNARRHPAGQGDDYWAASAANREEQDRIGEIGILPRLGAPLAMRSRLIRDPFWAFQATEPVDGGAPRATAMTSSNRVSGAAVAITDHNQAARAMVMTIKTATIESRARRIKGVCPRAITRT